MCYRENGGQRVVTFLMYLSTPEEGGETVFPYADRKVRCWLPCQCQCTPTRGHVPEQCCAHRIFWLCLHAVAVNDSVAGVFGVLHV
jgi:hypothetical protein